MVHQVSDLTREQKAAAELLLGRALEERELVSVQVFEPAAMPEDWRREVSSKLKELFAEVERNLRPTSPEEAEEAFAEAMRSSRPGYRSKR